MRSWERVERDLDAFAIAHPARITVISARAHFAHARNDPESLLAACEAALVRVPGHTAAVHHMAVALSMLGRDAEARAIIDLDHLVWLDELPEPAGSVTRPAFLDAVAREILNNPSLVPDPHGKATSRGLQTRALLQPRDKTVPMLLEQIKSAVDRYAEALPTVRPAFAVSRPEPVRLSAWAVVYPQDGQQRSHLHRGGWLSGVAYVTAPLARRARAIIAAP
jgi:hypothetical protein